MLTLSETPPFDWDEHIAFPTLSRTFAEVSAALGHRPLYAARGDARALVLVRALPIPCLRSWTARAKAYVGGGGPAFVAELVQALAARGIAHLRLGDSVWGLSQAEIEAVGGRTIVSHLLEHPQAESTHELFERLAPRRRGALRRAQRE